MMSSWHTPPVERAQPWLGTLVRIRAGGTDEATGREAIDQAINQGFAEIATVHRLMSVYDSDSDVSELNRSALYGPVEVHEYTLEVMRQALSISAESDGCFDISAGCGFGDATASLNGDWRDIEITAGGRIAFRRPLRIDLGGIAKGYAVDRAIACLLKCGVTQAVVNAGGDLRVCGSNAELIALRVDGGCSSPAAIELTEGSAAGTSGYLNRRWVGGELRGPHLDGATQKPSPTDRFVCVVAEDCMVADALTKVVLAQGTDSRKLLQRYQASACLHDSRDGWMQLGEQFIQ